jgi:hypothetical protein
VYIDFRSQEHSKLRVIFRPLRCLATTILSIVFNYISALYIKNKQKTATSMLLKECYLRSLNNDPVGVFSDDYN